VESAQVVGTSPWRIMTRHILRNATRSLPLIFTLNASEAILTLAGLGFLGFGIQPTAAAEWGYDLNRALSDVTSGIWWTGLFPGMAIVLTVLGLTLVGESMNDLNDPRLRTRSRSRSRRATAATTTAAAPLGTGPTGTVRTDPEVSP
jgi:peptide/nickel transport system permease protein